MGTLLDLIQTKVNYVVQEAIVVIKDIFRKYPNKYEGIISTLCDNLDSLDEPEARYGGGRGGVVTITCSCSLSPLLCRASMIWIIGEYAERIDNAGELLGTFLDNFADETTSVQLQLLTAIVKLFLKRPAETQELVQSVLSLATQVCGCGCGSVGVRSDSVGVRSDSVGVGSGSVGVGSGSVGVGVGVTVWVWE